MNKALAPMALDVSISRELLHHKPADRDEYVTAINRNRLRSCPDSSDRLGMPTRLFDGGHPRDWGRCHDHPLGTRRSSTSHSREKTCAKKRGREIRIRDCSCIAEYFCALVLHGCNAHYRFAKPPLSSLNKIYDSFIKRYGGYK